MVPTICSKCSTFMYEDEAVRREREGRNAQAVCAVCAGKQQADVVKPDLAREHDALPKKED